MATVTGLTAERMIEMEAQTVIDGEVRGDDLILVTRGGTEINTGNVRGQTGPPGPPVADGNKGDISVTGGSWQLNPDSVGNAELAEMGPNTIKGAVAAGNPVDLTPAQTAAMLPVTTVGAKGLTPALPATTAPERYGYLRADGVWGLPPTRFETKAALDLWSNAHHGAEAYVNENLGCVYVRYGSNWVLKDAYVFARGSFSSPTMGGNCAMSVFGFGYNVAQQDSWGVRPLLPGFYQFSANVIHSGGTFGGGLVWSLSIDRYTWANASVPADTYNLFTGNAVHWSGLHVSQIFVMNAGDWFRLGAGGDAGGGIDGRSFWYFTRLPGAFVG